MTIDSEEYINIYSSSNLFLSGNNNVSFSGNNMVFSSTIQAAITARDFYFDGSNYLQLASANSFAISAGGYGQVTAGNLTLYASNTTTVSGETINLIGPTIVHGNLIPSISDMYSLGSNSAVWKEMFIGPGTINISGPNNTVGTIGTDQNAIIYTKTGFATPFINIGPTINELDPGQIGGWVLAPTGNVDNDTYDLTAQKKTPGAEFPAGLTGPVYSLIKNPSLSYSAGNTGSSNVTTQIILLTETSVYEVGPITSTSTNIFLVMANAAFISGGHKIQYTVGRAITSAASSSASTNILGNVTPLALSDTTTPANYMAAFPGGANNKNVSLSGYALDSPGAGTFYYKIWMSSDNDAHIYTGTHVSLSVLKVF